MVGGKWGCGVLLERAVDHLVLLHPAAASKGCGDHLHLQMIATTGEVLDINGGIGHGVLNRLPDLVGLHHAALAFAGESKS
jgi:hypothetical protein